jgi:TonB-linked SusC/RagA family outer membrane protein
MKKRLQVNAFVRFIMRVSLLQVVFLTSVISLAYANELSGQQILEKKVTLQFDKINLRTALVRIEKETGAKFLYHTQLIATKEKVTLHVSNESLDKILTRILTPLGITFEADGNQIILKKSADTTQFSEGDDAGTTFESVIRITGQVTDEASVPLPGVNVIIKGTSSGTNTDSNGNYAIEVPQQDVVLIFSFIGYTSQEVTVGAQTVVDVKLVADIQSLDEVVVVAYGEQKKSSLTASVSSLEGNIIASKPIVNLSNSLAGRMAGVIATQGSGEPGNDGAVIQIRGSSTTGNTNPLLVVDGIYRDFTKLDPTSIETITVLKDAAAVAPYGLAGANGVILVTTKKGKSGVPSFSYNAYVGFQNPTRATPLVNSYEYALMRNEAAKNEGNPPVFSDLEIAEYKKTVDGAPDANPDLYPNSSGLKDIIKRNQLITYHNIELSGGTDKIRYYTALGYTSQQGQWTSVHLKKYNLNANIEAEATNTTTVSLRLNSWVQDEYYPGYSAGDLMYQAFRTPPTSAIYYSNGYWGQYIGRSLVGQVYHSGHQQFETTAIMTNLSIEQKIPFLQGLSVKAVASYDPTYNFDKRWRTPVPVYTLNTSTTPHSFDLGYQGASKPTLEENYSHNKAFTYQGILNYHNTFGAHDITLLGVVESRNQRYNNLHASIINYSTNIDELNAGSSSKTDFGIGGTSSKEMQIGYVYRLSYAYANKYLVEVAGRYDGHYAFAPGNKYSFFPAYSVGWNLSEEDFFKNLVPQIDLLKIRASYGESGSLPYINGGLASFQYLSSYQLYGGSYRFGGTPNQGLSEILQGNPSITWEKAKKLDIGVEVSLWNGKLTLEADYFREKRSDMLVDKGNAVPAEYGIPLGLVNAGVMSNHGVEFSFTATHTFTNDLQVSVGGNFTYARNKVEQLFETDATYNNPNRRFTGRPYGTQFGYKALGYFTYDDFNPDGSLKEGIPVQPWGAVHPGDLRYADISGPEGTPDGVISVDDQTVIGKAHTPQIMFGISPGVSFKGIDLNLLFQGTANSNLYIGGVIAQPFDFSASATKRQFNDHWTPVNTDAAYPRLTGAPTTNNSVGSSWWIRNAAYVRLKSLELGYTLPTKLVEKLKVVRSLRFYVSGQNLFTWTPKMKEVLDPEAGSSNGQYYFQQQVISVGTNVKF